MTADPNHMDVTSMLLSALGGGVLGNHRNVVAYMKKHLSAIVQKTVAMALEGTGLVPQQHPKGARLRKPRLIKNGASVRRKLIAQSINGPSSVDVKGAV